MSQRGPECKHKLPCKRRLEKDLSTHTKEVMSRQNTESFGDAALKGHSDAATSHRLPVTARSWETIGTDYLLELPGGVWPADTFDFIH